jgi:hypothetical protein
MASTNQILKRKFWKVFSEWVRRSHADQNGNVVCVSCGKVMRWQDSDAGHYEPKTSGLSIYFLEENVHPQCTGCNRFRHGNQTQYALWLRRKYGEQILDKIDYYKKQTIQIHDNEYIKFIEIYKQKIKEL